MKEHYTNKEKYAEKTKSSGKIQAKVILAKCPYARSRGDNLYGMRIQKFGSDWKRTWAFKIDAERAHHEGYDKERTTGTFRPAEQYPGCPYCGSVSLAQCGCGKSFCIKVEGNMHDGVLRLTCPWCGQTGEYYTTETLSLSGGGF